MNYDSRGGVSAAFSYPRAKASTSFPDVLNLLKRSKLIELIVKNTYLSSQTPREPLSGFGSLCLCVLPSLFLPLEIK